jgi:MSHA pilin protein MshC
MKSKLPVWGYTFIELITVLILIGIVSTVAVSRFIGTDGFAEYTYQNRLISSLRNMQQRAMHDNRAGFCFQVNLVSGAATPAFGPPSVNFVLGNEANTCGSGIDISNDFLSTTATEIASEKLTLTASDGGVNSLTYIGFDGLGKPLTNLSNCSSGCQVSFAGTDSASVCVESQGYVYAC